MPANIIRNIPLALKAVAAAVILVTIAGCGGSDIQLGKVTGRITKDGQPRSGLYVVFTPVAGTRGSEGATDSDGRYELFYSYEKKGALVGPHQVRISETKKSGGESTSVELLAVQRDVNSGSNVIDFELATK